ncbi:MAG: hypothetical protein IH589_11210 [Anaerolineales bacterium]|nr:hypothetical protein [Anaerolineales bacterium]
MPDFPDKRNSRKSLLLIGALWSILWFVPWGILLTFESNIYLGFLLGLIKLGLALGLFMIPGVVLFYLLDDRRNNRIDYLGAIPAGFALSVTLSSILGLFGRLAGFPFSVVKTLYFLIGLIEIAILVSKRNSKKSGREFFDAFRDNLKNMPLLAALLFSALLTFNDQLFFIDDTTYLAYLMNWQHSSRLGFGNIIQMANVPELERFWLALYPMGQAIISDLSGIPGLLLFGNYLELFLVLIAVITAYWFGCALGLSKKAAGVSVLIQISLFSWMVGKEWPVGTWFYHSLAEDKVSAVFHLAPVFFIFTLRYIHTSTRRNFILAVLAGVGLTLTHPVSLFFSCYISLCLAFIALILKKTKVREFLFVAIMSLFLILPYIVIRLVDYSSQAGFVPGVSNGVASFELDRYTYVLSDLFYGINPGVLLFFDMDLGMGYQISRLTPVFIGFLSGALAILKIKQGEIYWYVLSVVLLIILVTIPYTGWIFGYLTDARLIYRASWFVPLGLGGVIILQSLNGWMEKSGLLKRFRLHRNFDPSLVILSICIVLVFPSFFFGNLPKVPDFFELLQRNTQLAKIGSFIDNNTTDPVVAIALNYADTQILPGVSAHTYLISFREEKPDNGHNQFLSPDEIQERIRASNLIRELENSGELSTEKCELIREYEVRYVVADIKDADPYIKTIGSCGVVGEKVYQTMDLVLMELK